MLNRQSFGFVAHFLKSYPGRSTLMVILLIISGLAEALGIVTLLPVLEIAMGGESDSRLGVAVTGFLNLLGLDASLVNLLSLIVVALLLKASFRWLAMKQVGYTVSQIGADLRLRLLRALTRVQWSYFVSKPAGYFANAVSTEASRAAAAYRQACGVLAGVIQIIAYTAVIVLVSWQVALVAVLAGTVISILFTGLVRMSRRAGGEQTKSMNTLVSQLNDSLLGIKSIKAMGLEQQFFSVLEKETERLKDAEQRQVLAGESLKSFQEPILALIIACGLYVVLTWGSQPFSTVLLMVLLFHRLIGRFHLIQTQYQDMTRGESAFWSLHSQVTEAEKQKELTLGTRSPPSLTEDLVLDGVSFSYGADNILEEVSLRIPFGNLATLIGPSGTGKTTLVDLILGLYRPAAGEIRIDGVPLEELDLSAWRQMIGYVPQETILFHDTVIRNVSVDPRRSDNGRVEMALRDSGAWDFVNALPNGMNTVVGERGGMLSGGQRQRIALARALYDRPRLLILDEPTTAVDPETEAAICTTLRHLRGKVTILAISHQPALQELADTVYQLKRGHLQDHDHKPRLMNA